VVRNNLTFLPDAEHCESHLFGLFLGRGQMHVDNHTLVDHAKPNCNSNELYKGILNDDSTGVFNGKVFVRPDAQKTNAYQSNKSIVLTDRAKMYSKPELEIYADDVKCSHGATTGQLDREALFYLRSRGITMEQARAMMLLAFARDVLDNVKLEPLRAVLDEAVHSRFTG
jgi:Fe-S cluster assembly protein SufD